MDYRLDWSIKDGKPSPGTGSIIVYKRGLSPSARSAR
jgi:hypothetical protein